MTTEYETWLDQVAPPDERDPGVRPAGAQELLREIFNRMGPISAEELRAEGRRVTTELAREAIALVLHDLHVTTKARPNIELRHDDENGLIVTYNGAWTTPAMLSVQHPEVTCEIADYLQGEVVEDIWTAWPTCPTHRTGLRAEPSGGDAHWYCRTGNHQVAAIGQLTR